MLNPNQTRESDGKFGHGKMPGIDAPTASATLRTAADAIDAGQTPDLTGTLAALRAMMPAVEPDEPQYEMVEYTSASASAITVTQEQSDALDELGDGWHHVFSAGVTPEGVVYAVADSDGDGLDPRADDNISLFVGIDEYLPNETGLRAGSDFMTQVAAKYGKTARLVPIYVMDHSGTSYSTGDAIRIGEHAKSGAEQTGDRWDTSMAGFAIVTSAKVKEEYGSTSAASWKKAIDYAKGEVDTYGKWVNNELYQYVVLDQDGEQVDSYHGYYDEDDARSEGESSAIWYSK